MREDLGRAMTPRPKAAAPAGATIAARDAALAPHDAAVASRGAGAVALQRHRLWCTAGLALALGASLGARPSPATMPAAAAETTVAAVAVPDFVEIPAGPFTMGADPSRDPQAFDNEHWSAAKGEGTVDVPRFYIARREVTIAEFGAFARGGGWTVDPRALEGPPTHPAVFVSWPDALAYCRWLEAALPQAAGTPPAIARLLSEGWHVTLPSEAQWEKAARGTDRRVYPWGDAPRRDRANYQSSATTPVGQFPCPECAHGLADMAGNVWEWTRSPYQPYPYDEGDDRTHLDADALWVMRGGHFGDAARLVRTTVRGAAEPGARRAFIGFRVALIAK